MSYPTVDTRFLGCLRTGFRVEVSHRIGRLRDRFQHLEIAGIDHDFRDVTGVAPDLIRPRSETAEEEQAASSVDLLQLAHHSGAERLQLVPAFDRVSCHDPLLHDFEGHLSKRDLGVV